MDDNRFPFVRSGFARPARAPLRGGSISGRISVKALALGPLAARPWTRRYDANVPAMLEYPDLPVHALLEDAARTHTDSVAVSFGRTQFTYRSLQRDATFFSAGLRSLGVGKGDRVALMLSNSPELLIAFYGALRLGAVLVPCPSGTPRELQHLLADSGASVIVVDRDLERSLQAIRPATALGAVVVVDAPGGSLLRTLLRGLLPVGPPAGTTPTVRFTDLVRDAGEPVQAAVSPSDVALISYSIDARGLPLGAVFTHRALVAGSLQCRAWDGELRDGEGTMVLTNSLRSDVLRLTATILLATQAAALMRLEPDRGPATSVDGRERRQTGATLDRLIASAYLPTGAASPTHANPLSPDAFSPAGSVGIPLPDVESRVVDPQTGERALGPGEVGELVIRGPQLFSEYLGRREETELATRGGWLHTGDLARVDEDGYVFLAGRVATAHSA